MPVDARRPLTAEFRLAARGATLRCRAVRGGSGTPDRRHCAIKRQPGARGMPHIRLSFVRSGPGWRHLRLRWRMPRTRRPGRSVVAGAPPGSTASRRRLVGPTRLVLGVAVAASVVVGAPAMADVAPNAEPVQVLA